MNLHGKSFLWTYTGSYWICGIRPDKTCYTGRGAQPQDHVKVIRETVTAGDLTFTQTKPGASNYTITEGTGTVVGTEEVSTTYISQNDVTHVCTYNVRRSGTSRATGTLGLSGSMAFLTLAVRARVSYGRGNGDCGSYDGWQLSPPQSTTYNEIIYATGTYSSDNRTVVFTKAQCANGTCTVTGNLAGLAIHRLLPMGGRVDVTHESGPPTKVVIGQDVHLQVANSGSNAPFRWSVQGWTGDLKSTSVVRDYRVIDSKGGPNYGIPVALEDPANVTADSIEFHFIRSGIFSVQVTQQKKKLLAEFEVVRPEASKTSPAHTCFVDVNNHVTLRSALGGATISPATLGLGVNDACDITPGIRLDFRASAPADAHGRLALVQLITKTVSTTRGGCIADSTPEADNSSFYFHRIAPLSASGAWLGQDSPWIKLFNPGSAYNYAFTARDYLMYQSGERASIWVPIAELIWKFSASAAHKGIPGRGRWVLRHGARPQQPGTSYAPTVIAPLPHWTRAIGAGSYCL